MRRINFALLIFWITGICAPGLMAQVAGDDCSNPVEITAVPYAETGFNTADVSNAYSADDACGSTEMNSNDYVFKFTPDYDVTATISLEGTLSGGLLGEQIGLFLLDSCPDIGGASCLETAAGTGSLEIVNYMFEANHPYFIVVSSGTTMLGGATTVSFDLSISPDVDKDAGVTAMAGIASDCDMTATEELSITIMNYGNDSIKGLDVAYKINGGSAVIESITDTILSGETYDYTFTQTLDMSADGNYSVEAYTMLTADENDLNDSEVMVYTNAVTVNSFPYTEGFEADNGYWFTDGTVDGWEHGEPTGTTITGAASGTNAWVTNLNGEAAASTLYSTCMDFTSLTNPVIEFDAFLTGGGFLGGGSVAISATIDAGTNWIGLDTLATATTEWTTYEIDDLDTLAEESNVKLRFEFAGGFTATEGAGIDNIYIYEPANKDIGVVDITSPLNGCGLTAAEQVSITIENFGLDSISNFDVTFSINGGSSWVTAETITDTIAPGEEYMYDFTTTADLSSFGTYTIVAKTDLATDEDNSNDDYDIEVINGEVITITNEYTEGFEADNGDWYTEGANSTWEWGEPTDTVITHAAEGTNAWVTNLSGMATTSEISYLMSPCFDFSNLDLPMIDYSIWYEMGGLGGFGGSLSDLQASLDGGNTWIGVSDTVGGSSGDWEARSIAAPQLANEPNVKLRFTYTGGALGATAGVGVDDIRIYDAPVIDCGVVDILTPFSGCGLADETVTVIIENFGIDSIYNFDVEFKKALAISWTTETITDTIAPGEQLEYVFTGTVDLSIPMTHTLKVRTAHAQDEVASNDEFEVDITNSTPVTNFPYAESFEGSHDWTIGGTDPSWEVGVLTDTTVIDTAYDGTQAMVTNLTGNHNAGEQSYIESPCFDFSSMVNPFFSMAIWYETGNINTVSIQYTLDNGATWATYTGGGNAENWGATGGTWMGSSGEWLLAKTAMTDLAGEPVVRFRIRINAMFGTDEGVAIDFINIEDCADLPTADFSFNHTGNPGEVSFTNSSTDALEYNWIFDESAGFLAPTSTEENPTHTYTQDGDYVVVLVASNDCGNDTIRDTVSVTGVSVESLTKANVSLYPNPANNNVTIDLGNATQATFQLVDIKGQLIIRKELNSNNTLINLNEVAKGVYFVKVTAEGVQYTNKLIIQ